MWKECKKIWIMSSDIIRAGVRIGTTYFVRSTWYNKRLIVGMLLLFLLAMGTFVYSLQQSKLQWETWNENTYEQAYVEKERAYISAFHTSIEAILQQADAMGKVSVFAQTDAFSTKNLEETKRDFAGLLDVEPLLVESPFLEEFFRNEGIHLFVMTASVLFVFVLLDEQTQGLRGMLYAAVNGRGIYILNKIIALLLWTGMVTVLFYGGLLLVSTCFFQGDIWECRNLPIQSLSLFGNMPWKLTIGMFMFIYVLMRWMNTFVCSFVVWSMLFWIGQMLIGVGVIGGVGLFSLGIYWLIEPTHAWNLFHYCNPWYWMLGNGFFTEYRNLHLFSQVVNKNTVILLWMLMVYCLCLSISVWVGIRRYPCETSANKVMQYGSNWLKRGRRWKSLWMSELGITGMEIYKVFISQKGILVFVILVGVFIYQSDFTNVQFSTSQQMYLSFIERNQTVPNEQSEKELQELRAELQEIEQTYAQAAIEYEEGEMTLDSWIGTTMWYQSYEQERIFLKQMTEQTEYLQQLKERTGIAGWYVNLYAYNHLLGKSNLFMLVLLCFGTILLSTGAVRIEKKSGMVSLIRGSTLGERVVFQKKVKAVGGLSLLLYLIYSGLELGTVAFVYGLDGWMAPVQSILQLSWIPIPCSIGCFLFLWYGLKAIGLLTLTRVSCWIGSRG